MKIDTIEAVFIREEKHRFLGVININGEEFGCYIPSSSKLNNYFDVENKPALVVPIKNEKRKMKYRLIAIAVEEEWIVVDLNILNHILREKYEKEGYSVKLEQKVVDGYRTDLLIQKDDLSSVIEIKGIISLESEVFAPLNSGERANRQLVSISKILKEQKYNVEYAFVVLSKSVKKIVINNKHKEFKRNFLRCKKSGMDVKVYRIDLKKKEIKIFEDLEIELEI